MKPEIMNECKVKLSEAHTALYSIVATLADASNMEDCVIHINFSSRIENNSSSGEFPDGHLNPSGSSKGYNIYLSHSETSLCDRRPHYLLLKPCLRNGRSSQRANYVLSGCVSPAFTPCPVWHSCLLLSDGCSHDYHFLLRCPWQRHQNTDWRSCKSTPTITPRHS